MPKPENTGAPPDEEAADEGTTAPPKEGGDAAPHPRDRTPGEEYEEADGVKSTYRKEEVEETRESNESADDDDEDDD